MTMTDQKIIRLSPDPEGFGDTPDELEAGEFQSDIPLQHSHSDYEDDEIGLYVGVWDTETMVEAGGPYACDEFMWLIKGECQIKNNRTGEIETIKAGTPFVIPKGYDCQWHQHGYLRKFYVISENPGEDIPATPAHEGVVIPKANAILTEIEDDAPFDVTSGARPRHNVCFEDTTGKFLSGTWAGGAFESRRRPFPYNKFAYVESGSITMTDTEGVAQMFNAGDAFFIARGTECSATVENGVRLYFAIVKPG